LAVDPEGRFDVWVGETNDTAYLSIADLGMLVTQVEQVIDAFERHR